VCHSGRTSDLRISTVIIVKITADFSKSTGQLGKDSDANTYQNVAPANDGISTVQGVPTKKKKVSGQNEE